jgi:hypothetical protein
MQLGSRYRDRVSGFVGVAVSCHSYLNGCNRITLQPSVDKDGKLPECQTFDEPQLEYIEDVVPQGSRLIGGPEKFSDNKFSRD